MEIVNGYDAFDDAFFLNGKRITRHDAEHFTGLKRVGEIFAKLLQMKESGKLLYTSKRQRK